MTKFTSLPTLLKIKILKLQVKQTFKDIVLKELIDSFKKIKDLTDRRRKYIKRYSIIELQRYIFINITNYDRDTISTLTKSEICIFRKLIRLNDFYNFNIAKHGNLGYGPHKIASLRSITNNPYSVWEFNWLNINDYGFGYLKNF